MVAKRRVWVTRPEGQADALLTALEGDGWLTTHLPLLHIEPLDPLPGEERQRVLDLDLYEHLIFVSANAARIGLERISDYWPQLPTRQQYWAVGESTALVLEGVGLTVTRPTLDMSSEGLLALAGLQNVQDQRILIVRGQGGRQLISETLSARGARVSSLSCYRRAPVVYDATVVCGLAAEQRPDVITVSSGEGLDLLSGLLQPLEHTNLAAITLLVPSPRVAERARALGWQHIELTDNASDTAMLVATRRWQTAHLGEAQH